VADIEMALIILRVNLMYFRLPTLGMVAAVLMGNPSPTVLYFDLRTAGSGEYLMGAFRNTQRRMKEACA
jgi:hypothetical protein